MLILNKEVGNNLKNKKGFLQSPSDIEVLDFDESESPSWTEHKKKEREEAIFNTRHIPSLDKELTDNKKGKLYDIKNKYLSFETKVVIMVILIISFLLGGGFLIFVAFHDNDNIIDPYKGKGTISYKVCQKKDSYYHSTCLDENNKYLAATTDEIPVKFSYKASYNKKDISNYKYTVISTFKIYDIASTSNILYTTDDILVANKYLKSSSKSIDFAVDTNVDFSKYYDILNQYEKEKNVSTRATLTVSLYLKAPNDWRNISTMFIPLSKDTFTIQKKSSSVDRSVIFNSSSFNALYVSIGLVSCLLGILVLIRLINLICKVINTSNLYQSNLKQILQEYNPYIVIARDGYFMERHKILIRVLTFSELLAASNNLNRPIIYDKINNIKSEFYVEDLNRVYRYVIKKSDFSM